MLISNFSLSECSSSSVSCQEFRGKGPAVKAKLRSIVPTPSGLLEGSTMEQEQITEPKNTMASTEEYPNEIHSNNVKEMLPVPGGECKIRDGFSGDFCSFEKSQRTEDIFIREDDNGIRSHHCPLDSELDGERDEKDDYPDHPMQFDYNIEDVLLNSCHLDSEDIPFLLAEKPPSSESESSSDDSYTPMTYAPLKNHSIMNEEFLQKNNETPSYRRFYQKSMEVCAEYYGDELEDCVLIAEDSEQLQKCVDESETGEFEDNCDDESVINNQKLPKNKEDEDLIDLSLDNASSKTNVENKSRLECFRKLSEMENSESKNTGRNEQPSNLNTQDPNENINERSENNSESDSTAKDTYCGGSDSKNGPVSNQNSEIENQNKKEKFENISENDTNVLENKKECASEITDFSSKTDEIHKDFFTDSRIKTKINLNLEHVSINISGSSKEDEVQPDYKDELYSETLGLLERKDKREKSVWSDQSQRSEKQVLIDQSFLDSPCSSAPFEPVLKEEQRASSNPRNKLTKFFQSLKKKFEKKRKM